MNMLVVTPQAKRFTEPSPPRPFRCVVDGAIYSVRPERRGAGTYWYMRKTVNGRLYNVYLGPEGTLSGELLENAAVHIQGGGAS